MAYSRLHRRPHMIEAMVSRLHGHSSSSGAVRVDNEPDCIATFERKLLDAEVLDDSAINQVHEAARAEAEAALEQALSEPNPTAQDVLKHTYAPSPHDAVYPQEYTGLPHP